MTERNLDQETESYFDDLYEEVMTESQQLLTELEESVVPEESKKVTEEVEKMLDTAEEYVEEFVFKQEDVIPDVERVLFMPDQFPKSEEYLQKILREEVEVVEDNLSDYCNSDDEWITIEL